MEVCSEEDCPIYGQYQEIRQNKELIKLSVSSNCHICKFNLQKRVDVKAYLIKEEAKALLGGKY